MYGKSLRCLAIGAVLLSTEVVATAAGGTTSHSRNPGQNRARQILDERRPPPRRHRVIKVAVSAAFAATLAFGVHSIRQLYQEQKGAWADVTAKYQLDHYPQRPPVKTAVTSRSEQNPEDLAATWPLHADFVQISQGISGLRDKTCEKFGVLCPTKGASASRRHSP